MTISQELQLNCVRNLTQLKTVVTDPCFVVQDIPICIDHRSSYIHSEFVSLHFPAFILCHKASPQERKFYTANILDLSIKPIAPFPTFHFSTAFYTGHGITQEVSMFVLEY